MSNISNTDKIRGHIFYWLDFFMMVIKISKTYKNFITILKKILSSSYPIEVQLRDNGNLVLKSLNAIQLIVTTKKNKNIKLIIDEDIVIISSRDESLEKDVNIKLIGGINNGDVFFTFLKKEYSKLPVMNKIIVDIGSNIGDTPIYFSLRGAQKVIGIEPFPKNFDRAMENIQENNLENRIIMNLAGCASKNGHIIINPDYESDTGSELKEFKEGIKVPLLTLEEIVNKFSIPDDSILKIDCEGCEYEIINSTPEKILKKFSHIQIEYHNGYKDLKKRLEKLGYNVSYDYPKATGIIQTIRQKINKKFKNKDQIKPAENFKANSSEYSIGYIGFLYADK